MRKVEIELMTVTPLFLGGSDPRSGQPPELRPPSFRGAMRYWYRAALGGVVGDNWQEVRKLEGKVFGITSEGGEGKSQGSDQGMGSPVSVRISSIENLSSLDFQKGRQKPPPGKDYLFWSMAESGSRERGNYQPARKYIQEGKTFSVVLASRFSHNPSSYELRHAVYAFWLAVHLGGIGARSRRMAGSLIPKKVQTIEGITFGVGSSKIEDIAKYLNENIQIIRDNIKRDLSLSPKLPGGQFSRYDVLNPQYCQIWVLGVYPNSETALNEIGSKLRDFRNRRDPDHREVYKWLSNKQKIKTVERSQFGLPLVYRYTNGPSGTIIARLQQGSESDKIERRASPLWLSALRCGDGRIAVTAVLFRSQLLPTEAKLAIDRKEFIPAISQPAGLNLIEEWIKSFPNRKEVKYE